MHAPKLLIAEDEPLLREQLREGLMSLWPEARICAEVADGAQALQAMAEHRPQVAFLDIRMPHLSGLEVAHRAAGACRVVFVTAYNRFAVDAFERGAVDYLLKPLNPTRLAQTVARLRNLLDSVPENLPSLLAELLASHRRQIEVHEVHEVRPLQWIKASQGATVRVISVDDVRFFQADERYTRVVTAESESFIKTSIRDLAEQLDPHRFWQIHRSTLVNVKCIASVTRNLMTGGAELLLAGRGERLAVSRAYAHLFRQM
jgi:DNA-binding LytR/AlgR family response regulator